ncbi:hypothetical protein AB6A23_23335 [Paenibacillus tarimensis]
MDNVHFKLKPGEKHALGRVGDTFKAGKLGEMTVVQDGDGTQIMLGDPFRFDANNIAE